MRRVIVLLLVAIALMAGRADALTLRELIELSRAGLSDDVLVALIEVQRPIFAIDPETIKSLKAEGISERVMIAMIRSGRTSPPPSADAVAAEAPVPVVSPAPVASPVTIVERHIIEEPVVTEVAVPFAVPVYLPFPVVDSRHIRSRRTHLLPQDVITQPVVPGQIGAYPNLPIHLQPQQRQKAEPVFWGWGGKLRPDAWKPGR